MANHANIESPLVAGPTVKLESLFADWTFVRVDDATVAAIRRRTAIIGEMAGHLEHRCAGVKQDRVAGLDEGRRAAPIVAFTGKLVRRRASKTETWPGWVRVCAPPWVRRSRLRVARY